jgi:hypothetical protein
MRVSACMIWAGAAALWLAACEQERSTPAPTAGGTAQEAGTRQGDEAGGPATTPRRRELERRAYDTQRAW